MIRLLAIFALISFVSFAEQEKPESNADLRHGKTVFTFQDADNQQFVFTKKNNGQSYLSRKGDEVIKLSSEEEAQFEPGVVNLFIKIKYQLAEYKAPCTKKAHIGYLGDEVTFCDKDPERKKLAREIKKRFEHYLNKK